MKKDKKIHEIITQEKGPDDWRSFAIVTDSRGWKWELRGYGETREWAERNARSIFNDDEKYWENEGYTI